MKFRDIFGFSSPEKGVENLQTREMDAFADNVVFELKTLISSAITRALEERESRYMRSILEESFFSLESLVIDLFLLLLINKANWLALHFLAFGANLELQREVGQLSV